MIRLRCSIGAVLLSILGTIFVGPSLSLAQVVRWAPSEYKNSVDKWEDTSGVTSSPFHHQRFEEEYSKRIALGQIYTVASMMVAKFDSLDWVDTDSIHQKIMNHLGGFLEALRNARHAPGLDGILDSTAEQSKFLASLNRHGFGIQSLQIELIPDSSGRDVKGYFEGTSNEFLLFEWTQGQDSVRLLLPKEQVRQWRILEDALSYLVHDQIKLVSADNVQVLENAVASWKNFLDRGYSQMLWESLINGWLVDPSGFPWPGPPKHQWIILHPSAGLELSIGKRDKMQIREAKFIGVFGFVRYWGDVSQHYWGVSTIISLREDLGPGYGFLFHLERNWNLGILQRFDGEDPFLFFSADLLQFARRETPKYVKQYETLRVESDRE